MAVKRSIIVALAGLLLVLFTGGSQAATVVPDWNVPGIPDAGFPHFEHSGVRVKFVKAGSNWKLTATSGTGGKHLFQLSPKKADAYNVTSNRFSLTATFNKKLEFTGGNLRISGRIPSLGVKNVTLWNTHLTGFGVDTSAFDGSPIAIAFKTSNHSGWATQFSSGVPESVYLFGSQLYALANSLSQHKGIKFNRTASTITTVPVPDAVWLLGSALAGIVIIGRRKSPAPAMAAMA